MNTMWKRITLLVLAAALVLCMAGCGGLEIEDSPAIRSGTEAFLEALTAGDGDGAYAVMYSGISRTEFDPVFIEMYTCIEGVTDYTLEPIYYHYTSKNGTETIQMTYRMTAGDRNFIVTAQKTEGLEGLSGIHMAPEEQTTLHYTGTPGHMAGANAVQWAVLVLGTLAWVFVIWMVVDCSRRTIRMKALWLVLIILGAVILTLTVGSGFNLRFNIGLHLRLSSLICYGDGSTELSLVIPLGAIVYLFSRKKLTKQEPLPEIADPVDTERSE